MDLFTLLIYLSPLMFVVVGYFAGSAIERSHYRQIRQREQQSVGLPAVTFDRLVETAPGSEARLVTGSVVVSVDAFKRLLAGLRMFFGGRVSAYETLIDRARREAILRMKESADGAEVILNMRVETAQITGASSEGVGAFEVVAYGTAITKSAAAGT